jgi:hypothetical protein
MIYVQVAALTKDINKKITKVLSKKLSIEDYNRFVVYTWRAYKVGTRALFIFAIHSNCYMKTENNFFLLPICGV